MLYPDHENIKLRNTKCVVTGGAGFIGSNLVKSLVNIGSRVTVVDNLSTGDFTNLSFLDQEKVNFIEGDITNQELLNEAFQGAKYVFHFAALPSVHDSIINPVLTSEVNLIGTLKALEASRINNVKKFIFSSSCAVYGNSLPNPVVESMEPAPLSPYAIQKLVSEKYCSVYSQLYDLSTVCLRFFNVFGPNQSFSDSNQYSAVFPNFMSSCINNKDLIIYGDGSQTRDFIFVDDVVSAAISASIISKADDCVINIARGQGLSILELAETLITHFNNEISIDFEERRDGDILHSFADIGLSRELLGFEPKFRLKDSLKKTFEYFNKKLG
tara:strand:- start:215 stop:1198 length:984 start_codon:yes stop_codon:yes gene_type:complete